MNGHVLMQVLPGGATPRDAEVANLERPPLGTAGEGGLFRPKVSQGESDGGHFPSSRVHMTPRRSSFLATKKVRWQRQRHNNKLRRRIAKLEREVEAHTSTLELQQWGQICNSLNGQLGCKKTWHLRRNLLDPGNTKSAAPNQLTKIIHQ
ncbi:hypothetical protein HPB49_012717 [Dermacentor silvarum]|uniref:Uncharacterized protein n=1 Tax=Dermacentor silvarum TaxID=543639 RepID=A0ACB8C9D7_DERSI|nr:hypothetical protein HPB49_012717 [Dermacentor silvarum]